MLLLIRNMSQYSKEVNKCLVKIKRGDNSEFKELFDLTYNHLTVVAKLYLINKSYCDDVVMEVYERTLKYIDSYDSGKDGYNWLCKIAQTIAYEFNRRDKAYSDAYSDEKDIPKRDFTIDLAENSDLSRAIDRLDDESKTIVISYYYLGETYDTIGAKLNITKSAVSKKLKRILKKLRIFLENGNF